MTHIEVKLQDRKRNKISGLIRKFCLSICTVEEIVGTDKESFWQILHEYSSMENFFKNRSVKPFTLEGPMNHENKLVLTSWKLSKKAWTVKNVIICDELLFFMYNPDSKVIQCTGRFHIQRLKEEKIKWIKKLNIDYYLRILAVLQGEKILTRTTKKKAIWIVKKQAIDSPSWQSLIPHCTGFQNVFG